MTPAGLLHSDTRGSMPAYGSPRLFAVSCVLLRLPVPRHSPCALCSLTMCFSLVLRFFEIVDLISVFQFAFPRLISASRFIQFSRSRHTVPLVARPSAVSSRASCFFKQPFLPRTQDTVCNFELPLRLSSRHSAPCFQSASARLDRGLSPLVGLILESHSA